jgi:hypothetical protein
MSREPINNPESLQEFPVRPLTADILHHDPKPADEPAAPPELSPQELGFARIVSKVFAILALGLAIISIAGAAFFIRYLILLSYNN